MTNQPNKNKWNLIVGLIIIAVNLYWIWDNLYLMYQYRITGILWLFMYPDWVLILNAIFGLIGILIGTNLFRQKMKIKNAVLINGLLLISGALIKSIIIM
jgi:hypothetical protein